MKFFKQKNIEVITIEGIIKAYGKNGFSKKKNTIELLDELNNIANNEKIDGVLLRLDSPGGAAGTSEEVYQAVKHIASKKPVIASIGNIGCSGAYLIACGANEIIASNMSIVGSIGAIMTIPNVSKLKDKIGIDVTTIKSGNMKDICNVFKDMNEEERKLVQDLVSECHQNFINIVKEARKDKMSDNIDEVLDGRVLSSRTALQYGLIDKIGTYDDAIELLCKKLSTDRSKINIKYEKQKTNIISKLIQTSASGFIDCLLSNDLDNINCLQKFKL